MRRVAGVSPLNGSAVTWIAALAVVAVSVQGALYVAERIVALSEPAPRLAAVAPQPTETPNRALKAARESVMPEARLAPVPSRLNALRRAPQDEVETGSSAQSLQDDEQIAPPETGRASWYALPGQTASGEKMDHTALTAAHPSLPFGSRVRVANLDNGREVVVCINDRGPFAKNRIIDLSKAAAKQLGMIAAGVARVAVTPVDSQVASNAEPRGETPPLSR
jgi:rare lipoprotein A